jgi:hypothetical protein
MKKSPPSWGKALLYFATFVLLLPLSPAGYISINQNIS